MKHQTHLELAVTVYYDYTPACPATRMDPEVYEDIDITDIQFAGKSLSLTSLESLAAPIFREIQEAIAADNEGID